MTDSDEVIVARFQHDLAHIAYLSGFATGPAMDYIRGAKALIPELIAENEHLQRENTQQRVEIHRLRRELDKSPEQV